MNILFDINHPAHVHLFRNAIKILKSNGYQITITARDKDVTLELLNAYQLPHILLTKAHKGLIGLGIELLRRQWKLFSILRKQKIRVCVSATGACSVHACKILNIPSLVFYDTEHAKLQNILTTPFATRFITPKSFSKNYGKNHVAYNGVHDIAYLHPKYFAPNPDIYEQLNLSRDKKFAIIRFVSWGAAHDVGKKKMSMELKRKIISVCSQYLKVFIVSESPLDAELEKYRLIIRPERVLDTLYFAEIYIGDGGSMATESAILGTPSIFISSLSAGVFDELERNYDLMRTFIPDQEDEILRTIEELLKDNRSKIFWKDKCERFLNDKIDVTDYIVKTIMQYVKA